jgi:hypothetical protein
MNRRKPEPGSPGSVIQEVKDRTYLKNALGRARRRRSPWNLILVPIGFGSIILVNLVLFRLVWAFHVLFYPSHRLHDFWQRGISLKSFIPSFLMVFALSPGSMATGLVLTNLIVWSIPPARHTFDAEAVGYPGTDFRSATRGLWSIARWALPIGIAIALASAYALTTLK